MNTESPIISSEVSHEQICNQFAVISFPDEEETLYIVASSWLEKTESSDLYTCSWPTYKGDARIKVAVLRNETPSCTWSKCNARLIQQCATYESAEGILKAIEAILFHRAKLLFKKICKRMNNDEGFQDQLKMTANAISSESCHNSSSYNSDQSGPFICSITGNADESFLHNSSSLISIESNERNNSSTQTELFLEDSSSVSLVSNEASSESANDGNLLNIADISCHASESNFELRVFKDLNEIKRKLDQNSNQLNEFSMHVFSKENFDSIENFPLGCDTFEGVFPFSSSEDLQNFDIKLKDKNLKKKLIKHFCKIGGSSVLKCTLYLLKFIMNPSAAVDYCWFGTMKGKRPFYHLELLNVIQETVRFHFKDATDKEMKKIIQDWLRHAKERLKKSVEASTPKGALMSNQCVTRRNQMNI